MDGRWEWLYLSADLASRTRFYQDGDREVVGSIRCGILFLMAFWSGTSRRAFEELKRVLKAVDPDGRLELVVVDVDGDPELYNFPEFAGKLGGNGEAAWIRDGRIMQTSVGFRPECFEGHTRELLKQCEAPES